MLKEFRVQGYRGFKDELRWSLVPEGKYDFASYAIDEKTGLIKSGIVFGKNGSGKSNLGYALFDIINHLVYGLKKDDDYYDNFTYANRPDREVQFTYIFDFDSQELEYQYSKDRKGRLTSEELRYQGKTLIKRSKQTPLILEGFDLSEETRTKLEQGVNHFSIPAYLLDRQPLPQGHYLLHLKEFVEEMLWFKHLGTQTFMGTKTPIEDVGTFIIEEGLLQDFQSFLKEVSDQDYTLVSKTINDYKYLYCLIDGETLALDFVASTGTMALCLLYYWMKQIELQGIRFVFIDEFDAFYHFALSKAVSKRLFNLPAQVFVSSHNTALMTNDLLRPDCYFIIDGKEIKSLPQLTEKELQWGHSLEKLYRGGAFEV
ncbi:AAA family ATPase [Porphyromonas sp.]